jgi:hypothetical protein
MIRLGAMHGPEIPCPDHGEDIFDPYAIAVDSMARATKMRFSSGVVQDLSMKSPHDVNGGEKGRLTGGEYIK